MKRGKLPVIKRRKGKGGAFAGNCYCFIEGVKVDLGTEDHRQALKNLRKAMKGARDFTSDATAAAEATVQRLESLPEDVTRAGTAPAPPRPGNAAAAESSGTAATSIGPRLLPPLPPEVPAMPAQPVDEKPPGEPHAAGWAQDANAAAAEGTDRPAEAEAPTPIQPPPIRFADLPWLKGAFVTASKFLVAVQLRLQAAAARYVGDVELGPIGPPIPQPQTLEELQAILDKAAQPWHTTDPREPGRQIWEGFLKRICPTDLPIPDWVQAPIAVLIFTLPVQLAGMTKIRKPNKEEAATPASTEPAAAAA